MVKRIYKYPLGTINGGQIGVEVPLHSRLLTVDADPRGDICAWYIVDTKITETTHHLFALVGTGQALIPRDFLERYEFFNTIKDGAFVWHVFIQPGIQNSRPDISAAMKKTWNP